MSNALAANRSRDFMKEVKKIKKLKHCVDKPPVIDRSTSHWIMVSKVYKSL